MNPLWDPGPPQGVDCKVDVLQKGGQVRVQGLTPKSQWLNTNVPFSLVTHGQWDGPSQDHPPAW